MVLLGILAWDSLAKYEPPCILFALLTQFIAPPASLITRVLQRPDVSSCIGLFSYQAGPFTTVCSSPTHAQFIVSLYPAGGFMVKETKVGTYTYIL